ncbi:hypothetical protein [Desulforamulus aeronauticus]|uniref:Uncharacterized protein n=1 Tax=Desulforamulus aeronauticus DSM 10349 TaxID=1121421 RepID=A0A1M6QF68_9FIRM|nr:hypothetical protein [Desulforamulus aeronauticus]SHK18697.1 hypothetical protein SAMN02745123_01003 [Desulforamulus aeronauticus DSM 10349]
MKDKISLSKLLVICGFIITWIPNVILGNFYPLDKYVNLLIVAIGILVILVSEIIDRKMSKKLAVIRFFYFTIFYFLYLINISHLTYTSTLILLCIMIIGNWLIEKALKTKEIDKKL